MCQVPRPPLSGVYGARGSVGSAVLLPDAGAVLSVYLRSIAEIAEITASFCVTVLHPFVRPSVRLSVCLSAS